MSAQYYDESWVLTRRAHCSGCGGPSKGRSYFALAISRGSNVSRNPHATPAGTPIAAWVCNNCGHTHAFRNGNGALSRRLHRTNHPDAPGLAALVDARIAQLAIWSAEMDAEISREEFAQTDKERRTCRTKTTSDAQ